MKIDGKDVPVHPAAASYRMMRPDEFESFRDDIATHGQRDPVVLGRVNGTATLQLVDGRNRDRACAEIGIEPQYEIRDFANDAEVRAFVLSRSERRNLSRGEKAMGYAFLYPERDPPGRGKKGKAEETSDFSQKRLQQARAVLRHSEELAFAVREGTVKLEDALKRIKDERAALDTAETKLARLRAEAPDLADLVDEDRMKINEAITVLDSRIEEQKRKERTATDLLAGLVNTWHPRSADPAEYAERITQNVRRKYWPTESMPLTKRDLELVAGVVASIASIADKWEDS